MSNKPVTDYFKPATTKEVANAKSLLPSDKDLVCLLAKPLDDVFGWVHTWKGTEVKQVEKLCIQCPNKDCALSKDGESGVYSWKKGSGHTNARQHILKCVYRNNERAMYNDYQKAFESKQLGLDAYAFTK